MTDISILASSSALLSMDMQRGIVSVYTRNDPDMVQRAAALVREARQSGIKVIHVKVGFRPGLPEVSSRNRLFGAIKSSERHRQFFEGDSGSIHEAVAPVNGEVVVTKSRVSAFAGTDLNLLLRANDIDTLILCGIATSGVVLSTLLEAFDADYKLYVVKDCCADTNEALHQCLIEHLFPSRATVVTSTEMIEALQRMAKAEV